MSNIKISELESTQKIDNEDLLMVVQENKNKKIKFSDFFPKTTIELLTVSSATPTECNIGDKYYNTTTSKIYTATATNTWGTEGENPTSLYLYVDLEHKELYYFNGTTFVSYGGGSGGAGGDTLPIGAILPFSSDTIPNGWLLCDGSSFSATSYPELFDVIGVTYGWDDDRNPKLPDLRGRVAVGKKDATSADDTEFSSLGNTGGEKTHTLTVDEMPSHDHTLKQRFLMWDSGDSYEIMNGDNTWSGNIQYNAYDSDNYITRNTGGDQPHNNLQPYIVTNYIIKAKMTVAIEGEIIQEDGTASETNVYSAKATNNKIENAVKTNITTGTETATNEYIDGKRVYVKRATFTTGSTVNTWYEIIKLSSNCNLIDFYGAITVETEQYPLINDGHSNFFQIASKILSHKHVNEYYNNKNGWVIAKYTKN